MHILSEYTFDHDNGNSLTITLSTDLAQHVWTVYMEIENGSNRFQETQVNLISFPAAHRTMANTIERIQAQGYRVCLDSEYLPPVNMMGELDSSFAGE